MNAWKIGAQVAVNFNTTEVPAYHSITEEGIEIARVNIYSHGGQQAKKRAAIIAAAPDLLEALEIILNSDGDKEDMRAMANAAIEKMNGNPLYGGC